MDEFEGFKHILIFVYSIENNVFLTEKKLWNMGGGGARIPYLGRGHMDALSGRGSARTHIVRIRKMKQTHTQTQKWCPPKKQKGSDTLDITFEGVVEMSEAYSAETNSEKC